MHRRSILTRFSVILLLPMLLLPSLGVRAASAVHEHQLANGLKILVKPDQRAPILTSQVWYRIGSSYEYGGLTGVSHLLEHMMFQGTERLAPGEFSRIIAANGGEENAFTGRDYTAYYQNLASDRLEIAFELEAERMRHLKLNESEFLKELEVVKEERRMRTDDDPQALTYERFSATAYDASPYRNPVIGWPSDLEQLSLADVRDWYRQWYAPNNAILVVAGDVDPERVFALAEQYFGPLAAETIRPPKNQAEPEQLGEKRLRVQAPAKEPYLLMGYKTPVLTHAAESWEPYALELLASILDGGDSARLARELVRGQQLASSVGAGYDAFSRLPGLFLFEGVPASGQTIETLERALREQVARVQAEPVTAAELERVRNQVIAAKVFERDALFYQAMQIGLLETIGLDWQLADSYVDRLAAITPEQIQAVAQRYLTPERLTVAMLDPQPLDATTQAAAPPHAGGQYHVQ